METDSPTSKPRVARWLVALAALALYGCGIPVTPEECKRFYPTQDADYRRCIDDFNKPAVPPRGTL